MMSEPVIAGVEDLEIVVFQWSRENGPCGECGLPAAFRTENTAYRGDNSMQLCAVCAANSAADGDKIERIKELP